MLGLALFACRSLTAQAGATRGRRAALEVHGGYGGHNDSNLLVGAAVTIPVRSAVQGRVHATVGPGEHRSLTMIGLGLEFRAQAGIVRPYVGGGLLWSRRRFDTAVLPPDGGPALISSRVGAFAVVGVAIGRGGERRRLAWLLETRGYAAGHSGVQLITGLRFGLPTAGTP